MGRIQNLRMARAKEHFRQEMDLNDKSRVFFVDHAGNAVGFRIERADGFMLSYNGETGRFEPFEVLAADGAVNLVPYDYRNGKIADLLSEKPWEAGKHNACYYAQYFCGNFDEVITNEEYQRLRESGELYESDTMDYAPIFDGKIYSHISESVCAQIELFGFQYDDDRRVVPSKGELAVLGGEFTMNTKIEYLYRDADNYKVWNECVVEGTLTEEQKQKILECRLEGEWFIPHMVGLPEKQFDEWDEQSDHPYFELWDYSFTETAQAPTVGVKAADLLEAFERCKDVGWSESTPSLDAMILEANGQKGTPGNFKAEVQER